MADVLELLKQRYFTIMLDENLRALEPGLEHHGFKVIVRAQGLNDEALKRKARGWAISSTKPSGTTMTSSESRTLGL